MNMFFIIGLPRSRTAWLANFLTNGDCFCHHELMRTCSNLEELSQRLVTSPLAEISTVGDADPALCSMLPEVLTRFPEAGFVFVRRDTDEACESYQRAFPKLAASYSAFEEGKKAMAAAAKTLGGSATGHGRALVLDYEDLESAETCNIIHVFCTGRPMDGQRWTLLNAMRVTAIAEKARATLAPWATRQLIQQSRTRSSVDREWEDVLKELCIGPTGPQAFEWLQDLMGIALTWDHVVDGDSINLLIAERAFEAMLLKWPFNRFWDQHKVMLAPVLSNAVAAWRSGSRSRHFDCYSEPALAVAYALGGVDHVNRYRDRVHELVRRGRIENDTRTTVEPLPHGRGSVQREAA